MGRSVQNKVKKCYKKKKNDLAYDTAWFMASNVRALNMAGFIKLQTRVAQNGAFLSGKRMTKHCQTHALLSNHTYLHQNIACTLHLKKITSINFVKRRYSQSAKIVSFNLSDIGEGIKEVTIKEWFVQVGDQVSQFDNICEVQSDKASVTITSRYDGIVTKLHYNVDDIAIVGSPLVDLKMSENSVEEAQHVGNIVNNKVLATPAVRRISSEHNINLSTVRGTGRNGRVLKEDLLAYLGQVEKTVREKECVKPSTRAEVTTPLERTETIRGVMNAMNRTMTAANSIPHLVYSDEIIVNELVSYCSKLKELSNDLKVTYMPFMIKAASKALEKFPILNSSVNEACEKITFKSYHNIGVAMDTPSGLLVPNIKNVEKMDIIDIARELNRLLNLGKNGALSPSDLTGGTFTLSNIGSIGGTYTKPVILPPEVAIGGIGKIQVVPRFTSDGQLVKSNILCISWAADHRIIDGATVARFSNTWKYYVENPILILLNL